MDTQSEETQLNSVILLRNVTYSKNRFDLKKKLKTIEKLTRENSELENKLEALRIRITVESHPLVKKYCDARLFNLELLEENLGNEVFKKKERKKIIELLIEGAAEIWNLGDYRASKFLNAYMERPSRPEKEDFKFEEAQHEDPKSEFHGFRSEDIGPKTKEDIPSEIKSLYHDLVRALHPDKEQDDKLKGEKNFLMKKVTDAYAKNDLFTLLKLAAEHIGLDESTEEKFETYIRELQKKIRNLKQAKTALMKWGPLSHIYQMFYSRDPAKVELKIKDHLQRLKVQVKTEESCADIYADDLYLKTYLRELIHRDSFR